MVRKVIRSAKRDYWRQFCDEIGERIEISELWGMIRKMGGNKIYRNIPVIIDEDKYVMTESEKTFVKIHSNCNISEDMRRKREQAIRDNPNIMVQRRSSESTLDKDHQYLHGFSLNLM